MSDSVHNVSKAAKLATNRIADVICETPMQHALSLSKDVGAEVFLKLENLQHTGSFKLRGAANRIRTLSPEQRANGCVAASSGNHGAAVAYAMSDLGTKALIFVPQQTSAMKVDAILGYGGEVRFFGTDGLDTEQHAREYAASKGMFYLSPYNDTEVIAGQGTCGVEIVRQLPDVDAVFIAVGGGGLLSGVGSVLKTHNPDVRVIACQPEASAVMAKSVEAGRILDLPIEPTLSDGTAGGIEHDSITFELCRQIVDEFVLVSEDQIAVAMRLCSDAERQTIEGAAGVAVAALLQAQETVAGLKVCVVICGGNVSQDIVDSIR
jgi:threonine dehydratase